MTIRLYDSATREVRDFTPQTPGQVGIYLCGATPYSAPHLGHLRTAVAFDILQRWFERSGFAVTLVRNVTDIDDKILERAAAAGTQWWAHSLHFEREFAAAYRQIGCLEPTYEPRATGHATEMAELMQRLIERGHAYAVTDGDDAGSVYFDVKSFAEYGALTRQKLADMLDSGEAPAAGKRDARDFALWKACKPGEPESAGWQTPFGRGRPGWHLECSVMAQRYLGETFDIHGGGLDLRFPHHENEQAQSRAAGYGFAQTWVHAGLLTVEGTKMGKSLNNFITAEQALSENAAPVVRLALSSGHYRSNVDYSADSLAEAAAIWRRMTGFVRLAHKFVAAENTAVQASAELDLASVTLPEAFVTAMNDDFNVPVALAAIHEAITQGNTALSERDVAVVTERLAQVRAMLDVLGLDPQSDTWAGQRAAGAAPEAVALDAVLQYVLEQRVKVRAAKDWPAADAIRDMLDAAGISVADTPDGAQWSLKD